MDRGDTGQVEGTWARHRSVLTRPQSIQQKRKYPHKSQSPQPVRHRLVFVSDGVGPRGAGGGRGGFGGVGRDLRLFEGVGSWLGTAQYSTGIFRLRETVE